MQHSEKAARSLTVLAQVNNFHWILENVQLYSLLSTGSVESLDEGGRDPFGEGEGGGGGREASNPYVRIPVPRPRTSLLRRKQEEEEEEEEVE